MRKCYRVSDEDQREIIHLFKQGLSCLQIAARVGLSQPTCAKYVRLAGYELKGMGVRTPEHVLDAMVEEYISNPHATLEEVDAKFGRGYGVCRRALIVRGLKPRLQGRKGVPRPETRTYPCDESFFDMIDTEEKAYVLGFVLTDGNVSKDGRHLSVGLRRTDRDVLERIKRAISYGGPLHERIQEGHPSIHLNIGSVRLVVALKRMGIEPAKSLTVRPPVDRVPGELRHHFWRGAVDGDGWVDYNEWVDRNGRARRKWEVGLCGTEAIVEAFRAFVVGQGIETNAGLQATTAYTGNILYRVEYPGTYLPQAVVRLLYPGASIYLARKKAVADDLMARKFTWVKKHDLSKEEVAAAYKEHGSWAKAARALGLKSKQVLWQVALRHGLVKRKGR